MVLLKKKEITPPVPRNDSQESEEPWDQQNQGGGATMMKTHDEEMEDLDDGELPSLQRKPVRKRLGALGGRLVNGQRTTTRPLSPPNPAGLVTPSPPPKPSDEQRKFWSQLDEERDFLEEDAPDDELAAIRSTESKDSRRDAPTIQSEGTYPDVDTHESMEAYENEATFCGTTLNTISEMCSGLGFDSKPSDRPDPPAKNKTSKVPKTTNAQENTAIEVEFVESGKKEVPAAKKNAVLSAMAKKAKDDYQQTKKIPQVKVDDASGGTAETDFYNKLNASEKRKFLKLINSGMAPASAADQIMDDRQESQKSKSTASRKNRAAKLAFWKKTRGQSASPTKTREISEAGPRVTVQVENQERVEEKKTEKIDSPPAAEKTQPLSPLTPQYASDDNVPFAPSGINYYDAVRREEDFEEDDADDILAALSSPAPSVSRSRGASNSRSKGFAELREKNSRAVSAPRHRLPDNDDAIQPVSSAEIKAELQSPTAGTLVYAVSPESNQTVKSLFSQEGDAAINKADRNALDRIEKELSKPRKKVKQNRNVASPIRLVPSRDSIDHDTRSIPPVHIRDDPNQLAAPKDANVSFDTYMQSADQYSVNDNASVYTSNTGITGMSSYTQSSRVRRPGVARSRLEKAKQSKDGKGKGWHATIKEAARSANLKWSPETGWVDYEDPDASTMAESSSADKMHLDIVKSIKTSEMPEPIQEEGSVMSSPMQLPPEWEAERRAMLEDAANISVNNSTFDENTVGHSRSIASASSQPRGWAETMKEASKKLEKDGMKWDEQTGWTDASGKKFVSDSVDFGSSESKDRSAARVYAQIGENGSAHLTGVKSLETASDRGSQYISDDDEDSAPLSRNAGAFPTSAENLLSPSVDVVREKIDEEEFGLFGQGKRQPKQDASVLTESTGSRRGAGPVDADQVDETWDSDDDERYSKGWEDPQGVSASGSFESKSSSSLPTKPVPKLSKSKRDTSPIGSRAAYTSARSAPKVDEKKSVSAAAWQAHLKAIAADEIHESKAQEAVNDNTTSEEWKTFVGKKAIKATEEAKARPQKYFSESTAREAVAGTDEDGDSLFEFDKLEEKLTKPRSPRSELESSDLSPIRKTGDDSTLEESGDQESLTQYGSEAYGPDPSEQKSFFKRLAECASPVMPNGSMPSAHLAFMKANDGLACGSDSKYSPANICGKPDVIPEGDDEETATLETEDQSLREKPRSKSAPRIRDSDNGSVVSEDTGPKTAFLEALAMKTATSRSKRSSSRTKQRQGDSSVISSASSQHSEKWKAFLEKKRSGTASPARSGASNSDVSRAADRYAAIMASMRSKRSESAPKPRNTWSVNQKSSSRSEAARSSAADDLAAARVEAMMAALSSNNQDDDVVEI